MEFHTVRLNAMTLAMLGATSALVPASTAASAAPVLTATSAVSVGGLAGTTTTNVQSGYAISSSSAATVAGTSQGSG